MQPGGAVGVGGLTTRSTSRRRSSHLRSSIFINISLSSILVTVIHVAARVRLKGSSSQDGTLVSKRWNFGQPNFGMVLVNWCYQRGTGQIPISKPKSRSLEFGAA
ncbi:hypothetical protein K432DRAFT_393297 [Lepidopterella palustris CBS 459.81]|uniref:Uncharacterized protein n=1 Tax=Lepidopterella palustris CBS 459.81 TaxID=1314670 RepID=A0A8E2JF16_9PEZI|nr:hypothetical protein K432DRAFT_393297 [Lepidopterella palustris CBS 459.81]